MKYSVSPRTIARTIITTTCLLAASTSFATSPHYTPASENIKNFFSGTWEGTFQLGYAAPQSSAALESTSAWALGIYHDIGSRVATELQYFSSGNFNSKVAFGSSASFQTSAFIASLRGYGRPASLDLKYFGRLGLALYSVDFDNGTSVMSDYDSGTSLVLGFGAEKQIDDKTTASIEITYFGELVQSGYVNTINVGIRHALATW